MRQRSAACGHEEGIDVPVITTVELDNLVAPGETTGESNTRHRRFRSAIDHADFFNRRHPFADEVRHLDFKGIRNAETDAARSGRAERVEDDLWCVPENCRAPRSHVVEVFISIDIPDSRAFRALDKKRFSVQSAKGADGRIHTA